MKTMTAAQPGFMSRPAFPYPNAISRRQFFRRLLDFLLICASGVGIVVMLAFLLIVM